LLRGLGYIVHTPAELFGSREAASGAVDEDWLARVGPRSWIILGRDLKLYERPHEREAYIRARIQMFLLPGEALAADLALLVEVNLAQICAIATGRQPGSWRLTETGPVPYDTRGRPQRRQVRRRR
jgi:PIN like domain